MGAKSEGWKVVWDGNVGGIPRAGGGGIGLADLQDPIFHALIQIREVRIGVGEVGGFFEISEGVVDVEVCVCTSRVVANAFVAIEVDYLGLRACRATMDIKVAPVWSASSGRILDVGGGCFLCADSGESGDKADSIGSSRSGGAGKLTEGGEPVVKLTWKGSKGPRGNGSGPDREGGLTDTAFPAIAFLAFEGTIGIEGGGKIG